MGFLRKQYHWLIALIVLLQLFILGGFFNNANALFMLPVTEDMGITRTAFSLAMGCRGIVAFFAALMSGVFLTKLGFRRSAGITLLLAAAGIGLMASAKNIIVYAVGNSLMGLADGICISTGPARIIRSWFHKHQGTVLGVVSAATGIGGSILCILLNGLIQNFNWRIAQWVSAGIMAVVAVLTLVLVRNQPEEMDLKPFGEGQYDHKKKTLAKQWEGFAFGQLLRKPGFYILLAVTLLSTLLGYAMMHVMVPHFQDSGLTLDQATSLQSIFLLMLAAAKLALGFIGDRAGPRWAALTCLAANLLGLVIMATIRNYFMGLLGVICMGFALAHTTITIPLLVPDLFGSRAQTTCIGIFAATISLSNMSAAPIVNAICERIHISYRPVYQVGVVAMVGIIGLYLLLFWMSSRDKKKMESAAAVTDKT